MKQKFANMNTQRTYINAFLNRYTNLEKKCQFCGKEATIIHNPHSPYKINLVCTDCKRTHKDELANLKYINLVDYVTDRSILEDLTDKDYEIFKKILENNYTIKAILDEYHISYYTLKKKLVLLKEADKKQYEYVKEALKMNASTNIRSASLSKSADKTYPNNINKYKIEKNIVNKDIAKKLHTSSANISAIATGNINISIKKKCLIAEALGETLSNVFPEEKYFINVRTHADFIKTIERFRTNIISLCKAKGIKKSQLCIDDNIAKSTLSKAIVGEENQCTTECITSISNKLGVDPYDLVNMNFS